MDDLTEEKARQMDARPELDRICAEWWGAKPKYKGIEGHTPDVHHYFSTDWSAAGPLLEAMDDSSPMDGAKAESSNATEPGHDWKCSVPFGPAMITTFAPTPQLTIARACAVLVARGINRDELKN